MPPKTKPKPSRPWQEVAGEAQAYRDASISSFQPPPDSLPSPLPKNVLNVSKQVLPQDAMQITEKLPEELLALMASGDLTATAVTTAFLQRAALAQILASYHHPPKTFSYPEEPRSNQLADKLPHGTPAVASPGPSEVPRRVFPKAQKAHRTAPWPAHQCERAPGYERAQSLRRQRRLVER